MYVTYAHFLFLPNEIYRPMTCMYVHREHTTHLYGVLVGCTNFLQIIRQLQRSEGAVDELPIGNIPPPMGSRDLTRIHDEPMKVSKLRHCQSCRVY